MIAGVAERTEPGVDALPGEAAGGDLVVAQARHGRRVGERAEPGLRAHTHDAVAIGALRVGCAMERGHVAAAGERDREHRAPHQRPSSNSVAPFAVGAATTRGLSRLADQKRYPAPINSAAPT